MNVDAMNTKDAQKVAVYVIGNKNYEYTSVDSAIKDFDGKVVHSTDNVEMPLNWSVNASKIFIQKYMRKAGVPNLTEVVTQEDDGTFIYEKFAKRLAAPNAIFGGETSAHQVFHRLAGCWTYWGIRTNHFMTFEEAEAFYAKCYDGLYHQMFAPNSPQWFNTGLNWAYGIATKIKNQPLFYNDIETGKVRKCQYTYINPQIHACFIHSLSDDLVGTGGIMDLWTREATVFKYGSGAGTNYSNLRAVNENLEGGGYSSGLMSFLEIGDKSAGAIKSGGTTRRAARLVIVDVDHPEIESFIDWKVREENKVAALISGSFTNAKYLKNIAVASNDDEVALAAKLAMDNHVPSGLIQRAIEAKRQGLDIDLEQYDNDWQSPAYQTVSGQNANNSVSVTDEFMKAVYLDQTWDLIGRTNGKVMKTVSAAQLWDKICFAAWCSADPGIFFHDTVNAYNTVANDEQIRSANPCIEYQFLDDTACNLASLNLVNLYEAATFRREATDRILPYFAAKVIEYSELVTEILDISIDMAQFTSKIVAERTAMYRTVGLGYANLGSLIMRLGYAYGDEASVVLTQNITSIMTATAYRKSSQMAEMLEPFPAYSRNRSSMAKVLDKHLDHAMNIARDTDDLCDVSVELWREVAECNQFRNAFVTCLAPTGTIGLVMDCDTTGIEPDFSLVKHKSLAGGGSMKIVNQSVETALANLKYHGSDINCIVEYIGGVGRFPAAYDLDPENGSIVNPLHYVMIEELVAMSPRIGDALEILENNGFAGFYSARSIIEHLSLNSGVDLNVFVQSQEVLDNTTQYIFGRNTVEGCRVLKPQHMKVFACAVAPAGSDFMISADGHLAVMAAAQQFLSGAISKTVNLPSSASVKDISDAYLKAYTLGIKAISIYRDGSKLSQPLMTAVAEKIKTIIQKLEPESKLTTEVVQNHLNVIATGTRRRLPAKRKGYTQKATLDGHKIYLHTGEYADGTLGEIFIDMNKEGALLRAMMNSFAIAISIGLQYGVPLEEYFEAFFRTRFEPAGIVQGHENIKTVSSMLDLVFRDLAYNYLGRKDVVNVQSPEEEEDTAVVSVIETRSTVVTSTVKDNTVTMTSVPKTAPALAYTGEQCRACSAFTMVATGTCNTCASCGETTGC